MFPVASMLVSLWHTVPMLVILVIACVLLGWTPDPVGIAAVLLGFASSARWGWHSRCSSASANVFFRDFGKVVQTLTSSSPSACR